MSFFLREKIKNKEAKIAVLGLGYVGLPLAVSFAKAGYRVTGLDTDRDRVSRIQRKENYILDVDDKDLTAVVRQGRMTASQDFKLIKEVDVIIICVPTPIKKKYTPDVSYIIGAVKIIRKYIKKDTLLVLESTTYPGTTKELIEPMLEKSGLKAGEDFLLSFSPERIDPGNPHYDVTRIPKLVGGITPESGELTKLLYQKIIKKVHLVSSAETAEMAKLLENSFRIINIGWINELAMMCHKLGVDVWEVIEAAKTKPFGFMPFYPGLGVGGHCIPEDPLYLYWKARQYGFSSKYIKLSADTNAHMPFYAMERLENILARQGKNLSGARILVLGVTYKKDVKDLRKSPALKFIEILRGRHARVEYFDPIIPFLHIGGLDYRSVGLTREKIRQADCVVIAVDHSQVNYKLILKEAKIIFDIRNVYSGVKSAKIIKL